MDLTRPVMLLIGATDEKGIKNVIAVGLMRDVVSAMKESETEIVEDPETVQR